MNFKDKRLLRSSINGHLSHLLSNMLLLISKNQWSECSISLIDVEFFNGVSYPEGHLDSYFKADRLNVNGAIQYIKFPTAISEYCLLVNRREREGALEKYRIRSSIVGLIEVDGVRIIDSEPSEIIVAIVCRHLEFWWGSEWVSSHGGLDGIEQVEVLVIDNSLSNNGATLSEVSRWGDVDLNGFDLSLFVSLESLKHIEISEVTGPVQWWQWCTNSESSGERSGISVLIEDSKVVGCPVECLDVGLSENASLQSEACGDYALTLTIDSPARKHRFRGGSFLFSHREI